MTGVPERSQSAESALSSVEFYCENKESQSRSRCYHKSGYLYLSSTSTVMVSCFSSWTSTLCDLNMQDESGRLFKKVDVMPFLLTWI